MFPQRNRLLPLADACQEFETTEAAEESVAKYHEGWFMGNKIKVEISRGRNRPKTNPNEPGACFKCGQVGHWARCVVCHAQVTA